MEFFFGPLLQKLRALYHSRLFDCASLYKNFYHDSYHMVQVFTHIINVAELSRTLIMMPVPMVKVLLIILCIKRKGVVNIMPVASQFESKFSYQNLKGKTSLTLICINQITPIQIINRMDSLKGAKLLKADGSSVEADNALQGKV